MKFFPLGLAIACALLVCGDMIGFGQSQDQARADAVRVTMSMHPDGSRTVYNFDAAQHKAVAITTGQDGKLRETIRYVLDDTGRFSSAEVSGPDDHLRLKSRYKYDASGKQTGYSVFDASGKLVGGKSAGVSRPSPSPKPREKIRR